MFTMKKFAVLAVAGFMASSMIACGPDEDDEDEDGSSSSNGGGTSASSSWETSDVGSGWVVREETLGDLSNSSIGSSLDIGANSLTVYKAGAAAGVKEKIDVIYDGTNFWTAYGCGASSSNCGLKSTFSGVAETQSSVFYIIPASLAPSQSYDDWIAAFPRADRDNPANQATSRPVSVRPNGIYWVLTSGDDPRNAMILVKEKKSDAVDLIVGIKQL